jgi:hypothetical protein
MRRVCAPGGRFASGPVADGLEVTEAIQYENFQIRFAAPDRVTESDKREADGALLRRGFLIPAANYGCASLFICSRSFCSICCIMSPRRKK